MTPPPHSCVETKRLTPISRLPKTWRILTPLFWLQNVILAWQKALPNKLPQSVVTQTLDGHAWMLKQLGIRGKRD